MPMRTRAHNSADFESGRHTKHFSKTSTSDIIYDNQASVQTVKNCRTSLHKLMDIPKSCHPLTQSTSHLVTPIARVAPGFRTGPPYFLYVVLVWAGNRTSATFSRHTWRLKCSLSHLHVISVVFNVHTNMCHTTVFTLWNGTSAIWQVPCLRIANPLTLNQSLVYKPLKLLLQEYKTFGNWHFLLLSVFLQIGLLSLLTLCEYTTFVLIPRQDVSAFLNRGKSEMVDGKIRQHALLKRSNFANVF